ncbi:MAG: hemerythrin domain-containing protein [Myxococcota bacterium]
MLPSEVRAKILEDHRRIRRELDALEARAAAGEAGAVEPDALRTLGESFLELLETHMRWEDEHLASALRDADSWGAEREKRLVREHAEQRAEMKALLERLHDPERDAEKLAADLQSLAQWLRRDMEGEEKETLDPKVLRDDVVTIDTSSG